MDSKNFGRNAKLWSVNSKENSGEWLSSSEQDTQSIDCGQL